MLTLTHWLGIGFSVPIGGDPKLQWVDGPRRISVMTEDMTV
jgi:hypothetical protein